jgi:hypothetical protein
MSLHKVFVLSFAIFSILFLKACSIGFNKNGFYCSEAGGNNDNTPSCFGNGSSSPTQQTPAERRTAKEV